MNLGTNWRWSGTALAIDVPRGPLILGTSDESADLRRSAALVVQKLVRTALAPDAVPKWPSATFVSLDDPASDDGFVVTDGLKAYALTIIDVPETGAMLVMAMAEMPPADQDLWVIKMALEPGLRPKFVEPQVGVICFGSGTRLATPDGPRAIETLGPGDRIDTKDNGPQEILWTGHRRMSGARLHAMPHLRPVRFRAGAMGIGQPDKDLIVSPHHRMLVRSPAARAMFSVDEVLVAAGHLLNGASITVDRASREVTYIHVLLEHHNVIWANGLETESFHPAHMDLPSLAPAQHRALLQVLPDLAKSAQTYGADVRRHVTASEAAVLRHELAA